MIRVIAHLDMDCFYCQVEHKRLGIPMSEPLAVQQWDSVIAVNYAARAPAFGIKRGMKADECKRRCPSIHLVHVELIADAPYDTHSSISRRNVAKVSLERYRNASNQIMQIFQRHCPLFERASIDEAYLDVTSHDVFPEDNISPQEYLTTVDGSILSYTGSYDKLLMSASLFIYHLRKAVFVELGYTVSAGIACNKMLAKQASACFKPNRQTIIPLNLVDNMMSKLKLKDVRGLGVKLGNEVLNFSKATYACELQRYSKSELCAQFGDKNGVWIYRVCRGIDDEPVVPNEKPKSLLTFKSFRYVLKI